MNYHRDLLIYTRTYRKNIEACFQVHVCNEVLIARETVQINESFKQTYFNYPNIDYEIKGKIHGVSL